MATLNRKGQQASPGTAPLIILLVMAVVIIFYVLTVTPEGREELLGKINVPGVVTQEKTLLDVSPGLITGIPESDLIKHTHTLAAFTVDNTPQPQTKSLITQFLVKRSLTSDTPAEMNFMIADKTNLASANLEMLVNDRTESGELIVTLNEKAVYNAKVDAGTRLVVTLPVDSIVKGDNQIKIYAAGAGFKFWATNSYSLSNINLVTYSYTGENAVKTQTINLPSDELAGAKYGKITAFVKQVSDKSAKITVSFNGAEIYSATPKTDSVSVEIPASKLKSTNTLQWVVAKDGKYDVEFGKFTVMSSDKSSKVKLYSFNMLQVDYTSVSSRRMKCTLELNEKIPTESTVSAETDSIDVIINGIKNSYSFFDYKVEEDVCSYLKAGSNTIELSAAEDITIEKMKLTIVSK